MREELEQKIIVHGPSGSRPGGAFAIPQFNTASALLRYRKLRVGNYLPMAISLLEDMEAAV
jgi:hypothetical protein